MHRRIIVRESSQPVWNYVPPRWDSIIPPASEILQPLAGTEYNFPTTETYFFVPLCAPSRPVQCILEEGATRRVKKLSRWTKLKSKANSRTPWESDRGNKIVTWDEKCVRYYGSRKVLHDEDDLGGRFCRHTVARSWSLSTCLFCRAFGNILFTYVQ